jgi:hypothetical protein
MRHVIAAIGGLVLCVSLVAFTLMAWPKPPDMLDEPEAVLAAVGIHEEALVRSATLEVEVTPGEEVLSNGLDGLVTSVGVSVGDQLVSGSTVAVVDGVKIRAVHTTEPFWRSLRRGDTGSDVAAFQCILVELDLYDESCDGAFGRSTANATVAFNESIGNGRSASFDPIVVLWLPKPAMSIAEVLIEPGRRFPPRDETVVRGPRRASAAVVVVGSIGQDELAAFLPVRFRLVESDESLAVAGDLGVESSGLNAWIVAEYGSASNLQSPEPTTQDGHAAGVSVAGQVFGSRTVERLSLPTSSIVETGGISCVYVMAGKDPIAVEIAPVDSSISGATYVDGEIEPGQQVIVNPLVLGYRSCS